MAIAKSLPIVVALCLWATAWALPPVTNGAGQGDRTRTLRLQLTGLKSYAGITVVFKDHDLVLSAEEGGRLVNPMDNNSPDIVAPVGTHDLQVMLRDGSVDTSVVIASNGGPLLLVPVPLRRGVELKTRKLDLVQIASDRRSDGNARNTLSAAEARLMPGTAGDPVKAIMNFPGVTPQNFGSQSLIVRGGDTADNLFLLDGIRIGSPFHDLGFYSVFHPAGLESVDFYPGAFPSRYGNSSGAVIDLSSRSSWQKDRIHGEVDVNMASAAAFFAIPIGKNALFSFGGRRTYYEAYIGLIKSIQIPELAGVRDALTAFDAIPFFYDYNVRFDWTPAPGHRIMLLAAGAQDKLSVQTDRFPALNTPGSNFAFSFDSISTWNAQGAVWEYKTPTFDHHLTLFHYDFTNGRDLQSVSLGTKRTELAGARWVDRITPSKAFALEFGADWSIEYSPFSVSEMSNGGTGSFSFSGLTSGSPPNLNPALFVTRTFEPLRNIGSLFTEAEFTLGKWGFTLGGRLQYVPERGLLDFDPRVSLRFTPDNAFEFWSRFGYYSQAPDIGQSTEKYGNTDLKSRKSRQVVAGAKWSPKWFELKVEAYLKEMWDLSLGNPTWDALYATDSRNPRFIDTGTGQGKGIEILVRQKPGSRLSGWAAYTLSSAERNRYTNGLSFASFPTTNNGLDFKNFSTAWAPYAQDVTHALTLAANFDLVPKKFRIGSRIVLATGKPYTAQYIGLSGTNLVLTNGAFFAERYPLRFTFDLRLEWFFKAFGTDASIYIDTWNVQFPFRGNVQSYAYTLSGATAAQKGTEAPKTAIGDLPIVPIIGFMTTF